ncbi:MAG: tRNA (N(6)-L-threonylcarbamoyladenosine(37)-C(2))-methylthiotransferase [Candidatus Thermoplasmatota archaeon]
MKVYMEIYGCTSNKSDASIVEGLLKEKNHKLVESPDQADIIVVLTCTVIGTTERRMLSRLRKLKKIGKKIIVAGCMPAVQPDLVKEVVPNADLLPPQHVHHVVDLVEEKDTVFSRQDKSFFSRSYESLAAPISISEGCMFSCSYCITCMARGKLKSSPLEKVKQNVESAVQQGCQEIQLTAQDTASYGLDKKNGEDLGDVIREVSSVEGDFKIRVGMMNPFTAMKHLDSILDGFDNSKVYKFLHLPVQSGSDKLLDKMNRKYSVEDFGRIVEKFRDRYPDLCLSTDIIAGFPSETEEEFRQTMDLIKKIKPDVVNITRFSARPNTSAKKMDGRIDTKVVKQRSKKLTDLSEKITQSVNQKYVGRKFNVLLLKEGKNDTVMGRSFNYKPIVVEKKMKIGSYVDVEIERATSSFLVGSLK